MIKISVIIVNYESSKDTLECITALSHSKVNFKYEVIVVDNSKKDNLRSFLNSKFPSIKYIKSENVGYGAGNNLGVKNALGKYILFLNPDTRVTPDTLKVLSDFLDKNRKAAGLSPVLTDEKGITFSQMGSKELTPLRAIFSLTFINKIFPNNPISKRYFLHGVPTEKECEADAIPGSAFMIRKEVFEKAGKFDENIFLYFEESDLGKRIRKLGYKLYITPKTKVMHKWKVDKKNSHLQKIFNESRFYYFKKHFGIFWAFLVELFCRISLYGLMFTLVLLVGAFLRFFNTENTLTFNSELAHVYIEIRDHILFGTFPLIGPATSHPWLFFGPFYYWIMMPVIYISKFDPVNISYYMKVVSLLVPTLNYFFISKLLDRKTALISTYFIVISFTFIILANTSMLFSFVPILFYPFVYLLINFKGSYKDCFLIFFLYSTILNFHLSAIIYIPYLIIFILINLKLFNLRKLMVSFTSFFLPFITVLYFDLQNGFEMTKNILLWIPYRVLGFVGIIPKNQFSPTVFSNNILSFFNFIGNSFTSGSKTLSALSFLIFLLSLVLIINKYRLFKILLEYLRGRILNIEQKTVITLFMILLTGYLGIFIHGDPPSHYYLPLYPIPLIFVSLLAKYLHKPYTYLYIIFITLVLIINLKLLFSETWFFLKEQNTSQYNIPYKVQVKVASYIKSDSNNNTYSLRRVGFNDQFPNEFADNYRYLLWYQGNEPVQVGNIILKIKPSPIFEYVIYEIYDDNILEKENGLINIDGVYVKKTVL